MFRSSDGQNDPKTAAGQKACGDIRAQFDFNRQLSPNLGKSVGCSKVLDFDKPLDFALLELESVPPISDGKIRQILELADRDINEKSEPAFVVHHPVGLSKKVSQDCTAYYLDATNAEHNCGTLGGSSGSPVFANDGKVIALHSYGAYPLELTIREIEERISKGEVFRNKARPIKVIRDRIISNAL